MIESMRNITIEILDSNGKCVFKYKQVKEYNYQPDYNYLTITKKDDGEVRLVVNTLNVKINSKETTK